MDNKNYLEIANEIKKWTENNQEKLPPSTKSKDEIEKKLAKELKLIKKKIIKPYQKLKKEKDINEFEIKYPDIKSILKIIEELEIENIVQSIKKTEVESDEQQKELDRELEKNIKHEVSEFEYDKSNINQSDLADLIVKDIKIRKTIEEANKIKEKYEK